MASKYPSVVEVATSQRPVIGSAGPNSMNMVMEVHVPIYGRTWHRACGKRAGLTRLLTLPAEAFGRVSCAGCGRTIARHSVGKEA